jgi:hypothetical protein
MKVSVLVISVALISWACLSTPEKIEYDLQRSDSISAVGIKFIKLQDTLYAQAHHDLLDNIHTIGDSFFDTPVKVQIHIDTVYEVKKVVKVVEVPVIKKVEVPVYKKVVYSIYTPRGAHVGLDTLAHN